MKKVSKSFIAIFSLIAIVATGCRKDPIFVDDNGNPISDNQKPIASFTYTTSQITGGLAIKCSNSSRYATSYEWHIWGEGLGFEDYDYTTNPTFNVYSPGTYYISLAAENDYGSSYTYKSIKVTAKPTGYQFTSMKLTKIPMLDSNNESWDTGLESGGYPDIICKILNENKDYTYVNCERIDEVSTLPISWTITNCPTMEVGTKYIVQFLDYDVFSANDIMANCIWEVNSTQEGQTSFNWNAQSGTVSFVAGIKWIYPSKENQEFICIENDATANQAVVGQLDMNDVK